MHLPDTALLLRIFIGESDRLHGIPLYEAIVNRAREINLAGATVLRGVLGFGASSRIHSAKLLELSSDLPIVVEIVDTEEKLDRLMPFIDAHVTEGLITLEQVRVMRYLHRTAPGTQQSGDTAVHTQEEDTASLRGRATPQDQKRERMTLDQIKTEIQALPKEDRRKLALYILDLEKQYVQDTVGPQLREDLEGLTKAAQDAVDRISRAIREKL